MNFDAGPSSGFNTACVAAIGCWIEYFDVSLAACRRPTSRGGSQ
jgi:hypothetical protein